MKINIPDNINLKIPGRYILTIYVHPDNFSFSFHCPKDPSSYFFYKIDSTEQTDSFSEFKDFFFDNDFFTYPFLKTFVLFFSPLFTFIPNKIYSNERKDDFIKYIFSEREELFLDCSVPLTKLKILYPVSKEFFDFFTRSFYTPEFVHYSAPMINYFNYLDTKDKNRRMIINVHKRGIDIFCFLKKKFLFGNHFLCDKSEDAIYYILYTWKQLKLNQFTDLLYFTGELDANKELVKKLQPYIQNIRLEPIPAGYPFEFFNEKTIPFELAIFSL